ncbi:uncharacterized protein LOC117124517 [Anneissia japonica]|uniref:uncharacterized protein LOC117124517 n=1 Tax=Anneissia japonica TaxID=1529436 RepID=UPI00142550FA|nr:uncharacterized protein LOC117124517 [Anneissia japonica]
MSIETLLEAAKYVELRSSMQPTRGGDGGVVTQTLPASTVLSTEIWKPSTAYISPPRTSSKHVKVPAVEKKKENRQQQDDDVYYDEMEFSSSGNLSNSDFSGDWSDKRRQGGAGTREVHNKLEKNRRAHLKECFEGLRYQIPNMQDHKVSNLSILRGAFRFVQILKRKEKELEHELDRLVRHKIEMQGRLMRLRTDVNRRLDTSDKIKLPWHSKAMGKKNARKAERKRKAVVHHEDDDDGASTSTASEAEEEERRSRAHSPVAGSLSTNESKSKLHLQAPPHSLGHASVIQSTGQPKQQLKVVPHSFQPGESLLPTTVGVDNGHGTINKGRDVQPLGTEAQSLLASRPTVSQLLNKNSGLEKLSPKKRHGAAPTLHIIHTGNQAGIKQHTPVMVTQPKITMLPMTTNQTNSTGHVSHAPPGTSRNGSPMPTMLASALSGHLMHSAVDHRHLTHVSAVQPISSSTLNTSTAAQPVIASLQTQNIFSTEKTRPGLAGRLHAPFTQIPFSPAITQVLLSQPSITAYTLARQVPFSHTIIRQTLTPANSKYASSSTSPVTIMTTSSQKTIVSPKSTSPAVSLVTNTVAKNDSVDRLVTATSTIVIPAPQTVSSPRVFPTTYLQASRPGMHKHPVQQPVNQVGTTASSAAPILKAYPMFIPRYRTVGSVISGQRPLVSGVAVTPKLVTQKGNGSTATIIVRPSLVNTTDKSQQ